jgi:hypothetical protein
MKKLLVATGIAAVTATSIANAVEISGVKITPNVEVGWQKGKIEGNFSGAASNGCTCTENFSSDAKTEFRIGQIGLEAQRKNYFGGIRYTYDKLKGTMNTYASNNQGNNFTNTVPYSMTLERYSAYAGYEFNLSNLKLKPYASVGYFNSSLDKGNFIGLGAVGKLNLPRGFGIFASTEYDKTFGGKTKFKNAIDKDIKDTWEASVGVSKKINFAEIYLKIYYREHKGNAIFTEDLSGGATCTQTSNYKFKVSGVMIGLNF